MNVHMYIQIYLQTYLITNDHGFRPVSVNHSLLPNLTSCINIDCTRSHPQSLDFMCNYVLVMKNKAMVSVFVSISLTIQTKLWEY